MRLAHRTRSLLVIAVTAFGAAISSASGAPSSATQLNLSSTSVNQGTAVLLRATVSTLDGAVPVGQVIFCDSTHVSVCAPAGANVLALAQLTPAGTAKRMLRLGIGSHSIVARFLGTTTDAGSSSAPQTLTVHPPAGRAVTQVSLAATPVNQQTQQGLYNLSAAVSTPGGGVPATGAVSFTVTSPHATTVLGTAALTTTAPPLLRFNSAPSSPTGKANPVIADWNEDGIPDLALIETSGSAVSALPGAGDGTFPAPGTANAVAGLCGSGCVALATADFNSDDHADLVTLSPSVSGFALQFAYGTGSGTFTVSTPVAVALGSSLTVPQLVVGDYNGDGLPDLIVNGGVRSGAGFAVALQRADHSFAITYPKSFGIAGVTPPAMIEAADISGDGKTDFVGLSSTALLTFTSNGDGTFTVKEVVAGSDPAFFTVADFNADGFADVVVFSRPNYVALGTPLFGDGKGSFTTGSTLVVDFPPSTNLLSLDAVDVNGDGIADLLLGQLDEIGYEGQGPITVLAVIFTSNGAGGFTESVSSLPSELPNALETSPVVTADLNGDGLPDVVYPQQSGCCVVLLNESGAGSSSASLQNVQMPVGAAGGLSLTAAYGGDTRYQPGSSPAVRVDGTPVPTTLQVTASPSTAVEGQAVTLKATLLPFSDAGYSTDGETVTFSLGNGSYGSYPTAALKNGIATATVSNLPLGNNLIFANYNGDGTFTSSSSSEISVVVNQALPPAAALKGTYVFRVAGTLPQVNGRSNGIAAVGAFSADGAGNITSGEEDLNSGPLTLTAAALQGSYRLNAAGTGTLHLVTGSGQAEDFVVVLASRDANGIAQKLTLLSTGSAGTVAAGEAVMQRTGYPLAGGGYTLRLSGETACQPASCSTFKGAEAVSLLASLIVAGGAGSGPAAENLAGVLTVYPTVSIVLLQEDSLERIALTINNPSGSADQPVNYAGYLTSGGEMYLVSIDPHSNKILLSGSLSQQ